MSGEVCINQKIDKKVLIAAGLSLTTILSLLGLISQPAEALSSNAAKTPVSKTPTPSVVVDMCKKYDPRLRTNLTKDELKKYGSNPNITHLPNGAKPKEKNVLACIVSKEGYGCEEVCTSISGQAIPASTPVMVTQQPETLFVPTPRGK